jgi:hypothetical protein
MNSLVQVNLVALATAQIMAWHDMTQVDKVDLFAHHIIHFETHAEDDSQTDSCESLYKASNSLTFASIWLESSGKLLTSQGPNHGMAWYDPPRWTK